MKTESAKPMHAPKKLSDGSEVCQVQDCICEGQGPKFECGPCGIEGMTETMAVWHNQDPRHIAVANFEAVREALKNLTEAIEFRIDDHRVKAHDAAKSILSYIREQEVK